MTPDMLASSERGPRALLAFPVIFTAVLTAALGVVLWLYQRHGEAILDRLEAAEPSAVYAEAQRLERAGALDAALAHYREALELGLDGGARYDCVRDLPSTIFERGRIQGVSIELEQTVLDGGNFDAGSLHDNPWVKDNSSEGWHVPDPLERVHGTHGLRLELRLANGPLLRDQFSLIPGRQYRLSYWLRTLDVEPGIELALRSLRNESIVQHRYAGTQEWHQQVFMFNAPESESGVAFQVECVDASNNSACRGTAWFDAITLDTGPNELLRNGSFELGENGRRHWLGELPDGVAATADNASFVEGRQALRVDLPQSTGFSLWQSKPVEPGARYRLTGWLRTQDLGDHGAFLVVTDADRGWQAFNVETNRITRTSDWAPLTLEFQPPPSTERISVHLTRRVPDGISTPPASVWFDALTLAPIDDGN